MAIALPRQVLHFIRNHDLIRFGDHVLVAVSGGADSVALIHILHELRRRLKLRLIVAHLNHKIRGREADADARFVGRLARRLRLGFAGRAVDVPAIARRSGVSLEMAGRKARYEFFAHAARARGCDVVATAHTADDNAENILLMLIRGCGLQGLTGIAPRAQVGKTNVIRPLLTVERRAIENYLRERGIAWREDVSNADPAFLRNRVRHELLPLLTAKYNKNIRDTLNRVGGVLREENDFIARAAEKAYSGAGADALMDKDSKVFVGPLHFDRLNALSKVEGLATRRLGSDGLWRAAALHERRKRRKKYRSPALNAKNLSAHHIALRRRALRRWLLANGVGSEAVDFQLINKIDNLIIKPGRGGQICLAGGVRVRRSNDCLMIEKQSIDVNKNYRIKIKIPGITVLPGSDLCVKARIGPGVCRERGAFGRYPAQASLSLNKWRRRTIRARSWRAGDRMQPYGLAGSKKIQDIFSDAKVPVALRHKLPVFECGGEIIWIPGYRIARGWEVPDDADNALQLTVDVVQA